MKKIRFCAVLLGFFLLWMVLRFFPSPVWWCCLPSPPLGEAAFPPSLLTGGAAWCSPFLGGVAFPISFQVVLPSFSFCCVGLLFSPPLLLGGVAWSTLPWVVLRCSSLFAWCCFPFHVLGSGALLLSTVGCCLVFLLLWAVLPFPSPLAWCCLPLLWVELFFLPPLSVGWGCLVSPALGVVAVFSVLLVGLLSPSLLMGGAAWCSYFFGVVLLFSLLLRGVAVQNQKEKTQSKRKIENIGKMKKMKKMLINEKNGKNEKMEE